MVGRDELARIALGHDTSMARAMLCALGAPLPWAFRRRSPTPPPADYVDPDVLWCFKNHGSPMDLMR